MKIRNILYPDFLLSLHYNFINIILDNLMEINNITLPIPAPGACNLYFHKEVNSDTTAHFINELMKVHENLLSVESRQSRILQTYCHIHQTSAYKIILHLNTPGGVCYDGFSLYSYIKNLNRPVEIVCSGLVASMGIPILLSVPLEYRTAYKDTTFMIHQVSSFACGMCADLDEQVDEAKRIHNQIFNIIAANTKISKEQLDECYNNRKNWFMSADEALEVGLISKII